MAEVQPALLASSQQAPDPEHIHHLTLFPLPSAPSSRTPLESGMALRNSCLELLLAASVLHADTTQKRQQAQVWLKHTSMDAKSVQQVPPIATTFYSARTKLEHKKGLEII